MLKKKIKSSALSFVLLLGVARATSDIQPIKLSSHWSNVAQRPAFVAHSDMVSVPMHGTEVGIIRDELARRYNLALNPPGTNQLKVITQSEWRVLSQRLKMEDVQELMKKHELMKYPLKPNCLCKVETVIRDKKDQAWVILGEAPEMLQFRREVWRLYMTKGGAGPDFQWKKWYPSITVGSTGAVFDDELALKEKSPCEIPLAP